MQIPLSKAIEHELEISIISNFQLRLVA